MPLLDHEPDMFPDNLWDLDLGDRPWWAIYTRSRQEKSLMRQLRTLQIPHYSPMIERRYRSPAGRIRKSYLPLFSNYVFLQGDDVARHAAVCTGTVSRCVEVIEVSTLVADLKQVHGLVQTGQPLAPEARIEPGDMVRIKSGTFAGYEGIVIRRAQEVRLLVLVHFMNQGVSVALDDCVTEVIAKANEPS